MYLYLTAYGISQLQRLTKEKNLSRGIISATVMMDHWNSSILLPVQEMNSKMLANSMQPK